MLNKKEKILSFILVAFIFIFGLAMIYVALEVTDLDSNTRFIVLLGGTAIVAVIVDRGID